MTKGMYEVKLMFSDGELRTYKCCGSTEDIAIQKLLHEFPTATVIVKRHLYDYED